MIQLHPYQQPHFERLLTILQKRGSALDASDTGTGKTVVALFLCKALDIVPLVVGPKSARAGWERLAALVGVGVEFVNYERLRGRRSIRKDGQYVVNTDWLVEVPWGSGSFLKWKSSYKMIIFDECHRCGGGTSLNSKAMIAAKRQAQYVLALSATAADDPRQMKALGYLLDLHGLGKKTPPSRLDFRSWQLRHGCSPGIWGGMDFSSDPVKQAKAFERLHNELFPHRGARIRKADVPGFPKTQIEIKRLTDESGQAKGVAETLHEANKVSDLESAMSCRQRLEHLKVAPYADLVEDYSRTSKVVVFMNFTQPLFELYDLLCERYGRNEVGYISGTQTGPQGEAERQRFLDDFQANKLTALVCNTQASGEACNMHDPTGKAERTTIISPCESGRRYQQLLGRVNRDGGAWSQQFLTFFADTYEEVVADRVEQKNFNLTLLNDAAFLC